MTFDTLALRNARRSVTTTFVVRVGSAWSPIRAAAVWPIAEVLGAGDGLCCGPGPTAGAAPADAGLGFDVVDPDRLAPPRRRRRERQVSSRAVFLHTVGA